MSKSVRILKGYRLIYKPEHPRSMRNESWFGYIPEHVVIAEEAIGRQLQENEVVHHLDFNRINNAKENLLVLDKSQHAKLHKWIRAGMPIFHDGSSARFCKACENPLNNQHKNYCSEICSNKINRKVLNRPSLESIEKDRETMSYADIGKKYGVSGNAVKKWVSQYKKHGTK